MKKALIPGLLLMVLTVGCGESASTGTPSTSDVGDGAATTDLGESSSEPTALESEATPEGTQIALTPENALIQFTGIHTDKSKDDRVGHFEQFTGTAVVDGDALKWVNVDIQTNSLTTPIDKLTNHLKDADFFYVKEHPKAKFVSTKIQDAGDGTVTITGDLTLLGTTKEITFPATATTDNGLKLNAEFEIDRTEFGMTYGEDSVEKMVPMLITVDA